MASIRVNRRLLGATLLALIVATATPHATSCANPIPLGQVVTPACTWIVAQWDPGVWLDNLGQYWAWLVRGTEATGISRWPVTIPRP